MPQTNYKIRYDDYGNTAALETRVMGAETLANNYLNKGTAFSNEERRLFGLKGILPPTSRSMAQQLANNCRTYADKGSELEKYIYVRSLFDRNATLAHALIASDIERHMATIYTPTVGLACQNYSSMFRKANGIHLYPGNIDEAEEILQQFSHRDIRVAVVTDNQGILGLGDQGAGGIAICLGKLMLYTQGAGIAPWHCLPISLDVGTDNEQLLADEGYVGWRQPRLQGQHYLDFIERFSHAFQKVFPHALCQWEDFSKQNAFTIRDSYMDALLSFNDDIQGTGAICLAAIMAAMQHKGERLSEQRFVIHGAGAGGIGVAEQICSALQEEGLSETEALARIFAIDRQGLLLKDGQLDAYQQKFGRDPASLTWLSAQQPGSLENIIAHEKITVLIGTSGQGGCFTEEVVRGLLAHSSQPVILPLSNPTSMAEACPEDIQRWSQGQALLATGSPFAPLTTEQGPLRVAQCNNVFIFPGVGLGALAAGARAISPAVFTAAARAVAAMVPAEELARGVLLPPVAMLRQVSHKVACACGEEIIRLGLSGPCAFSRYQHMNQPQRLHTLIDKMRWQPNYLPLLAASDKVVRESII